MLSLLNITMAVWVHINWKIHQIFIYLTKMFIDEAGIFDTILHVCVSNANQNSFIAFIKYRKWTAGVIARHLIPFLN